MAGKRQAVSMTTELRRGDELAGYRIEALIGRGGMSAVYLAHDPRLKRRVALKLLSGELAANARFRERFLRESELLASIDHAHVIPIYEASEASGVLFIAMRYVDGTDLRSLLERERPLEPRRALELCGQAASALDAAHARGLVHRDVKPGNILIATESGEEHVYLADFGLTKEVTSESGLTEAGQFVGTADYVAPEQIENRDSGGRADLYSLGCVLYECLAGAPPFGQRRLVALLYAHISEPPPSLAARRPEFPTAIDPVIAKALAKQPAERYSSCRELVLAARGALGLDASAPPRLTRRRLLLIATGGAFAVAAAAAVPAVLLSRGSANTAVPPPPAVLPLKGDSVVRIDAATSHLVHAIPVALGPVRVTFGDGSVWVASDGAKTLSRIDPATNRVVDRVDISRAGASAGTDSGTGPVVGDGAVWFLTIEAGLPQLYRYDVRSHLLAAPVEAGIPFAVALGAGAAWVLNDAHSSTSAASDETEILRYGVRNGKLEKRIPCAGCGSPFVFSQGSIWMTTSRGLAKFDPTTAGVTQTIPLEVGFQAMAVGREGIWLLDETSEAILGVDAATGSVTAPIRVGRGASYIAVGAGSVWVANTRDRTVTRYDPRTADITTIPVGGTPTSIAVGDGAVWVGVEAP
jgi:serine/threonine-protein kinase